MLVVINFLFEPGQSCGQRRNHVGIGSTRSDEVENLVERHGWLAVEWLGGRLVFLADAHGIDDDEVRLVLGVGRDALQHVGIDHPATTPLHLLEVGQRPDVPHEDQAFERLHVGSRGDHVHGDGDTREIRVAELGQEFVGLLAGAFRRDLLAEVVPLAEFLPNDPHDVLGVQIGLGEDERFGNLGAAGKDLRQLVLERADDQANLILGHHVPVKLVGGVGQVVVEFLVFLPLVRRSRCGTKMPGSSSELGPVLGDLRFDAVHVVADIDAIDHGLFVGIVLHQVAVEEADGLRRRRGGQADQEGIEVFENLPPDVVDAAVAFIDHDEIERLDGDLRRCRRPAAAP